MPNAWDITDHCLTTHLQVLRANYFNDPDLQVRLFKNDFTPIPGMIQSDLVEADFVGYNYGLLDATGWGSITVTDHIAQTINATITPFTAAPEMVGSQTIYGYYVLTGTEVLEYAERFEDPRVMSADESLRLRAIFRYKTST